MNNKVNLVRLVKEVTGFSTDEIASELNISSSYVSKMISGALDITEDNEVKLVKLLKKHKSKLTKKVQLVDYYLKKA